MEDLHGDDAARIPLILTAIFLVVVIGGIIDLILDRPTTLWSAHVAFEVLMVAVSLGAATYLARRWYRTTERLAAASRHSVRLRAERAAWQERAATALAGLSSAISEQFDAWSLTPTERRVAIGLLKGLSHKRMAASAGGSERTVRQHSVAIYRKSGLSGRAALAGFFLEPLLLPEETPNER